MTWFQSNLTLKISPHRDEPSANSNGHLQKVFFENKEYLRLFELKIIKKITNGLAVRVPHKIQPKPTCARNSKMTKYIKLMNKVHVPYILHLPLVRTQQHGFGLKKESQLRAQDHMVL